MLRYSQLVLLYVLVVSVVCSSHQNSKQHHSFFLPDVYNAQERVDRYDEDGKIIEEINNYPHKQFYVRNVPGELEYGSNRT